MAKKNQVKVAVEQEAAKESSTPEDGIGSRIRAARETRGLSQTAVATRTKIIDPKGQGISRTVLVGYEAGQTKPGAREIRLLCETLFVTPNWLVYGADDIHELAHPALEVFRNNPDLVAALRLALAICVLRPHERSAFTSLVLSMAGRELGDLKLSGLFVMASLMAEPVFDQIKSDLPEGATADDPLESLVKRFIEGTGTNFGNKLIFDDNGNVIGGEWLYREPKK